eukprot:scaffold8005_cov118-Isochrysis_galbana.AAC.18
MLGLVFGHKHRFFYLERRAGHHHVHPPIITSEGVAFGADNRPTGPAGYDDPSRWDDPNAAARCQTPADLTGAAGADRAGPGVPAGAKGLLLQAPEGMAAATTSGVSCRAGRASTAA